MVGGMGLRRGRVLAALPETTKSANPSFAYLDGILGGMRNRGGGADQREAVKQVLKALGGHILNPTEGLIQAYEGILRQGFAPETVLRAARCAARKGQGTFEKLEDVLSKWLRLGLTTPEAVDEYLERRAALRQLTLRVWRSRVGYRHHRRQPGPGAGVAGDGAGPAGGIRSQPVQRTQAARPLHHQALKGIQGGGDYHPGAGAGIQAPLRPEQGGKPAALDYAQRQVDEHYFDGVFADLSAPAEGGGAS